MFILPSFDVSNCMEQCMMKKVWGWGGEEDRGEKGEDDEEGKEVVLMIHSASGLFHRSITKC